MQLPDRPVTAGELKARLEAERKGVPFLLFRDGEGTQRIVELPEEGNDLSIGRSPAADVVLDWDSDASRVHAELQRVGDVWTVADDGLSRNGTYLNDERIHGRRRLSNGDRIRCGRTRFAYAAPAEDPRAVTTAATELERPQISDAQRRVLIALATPYAGADPFATPASNPEISAQLHLSVAAVKTHLRALFQKFGIENLPQNQKRTRLVAVAMQSGEVTASDLLEETRKLASDT